MTEGSKNPQTVSIIPLGSRWMKIAEIRDGGEWSRIASPVDPPQLDSWRAGLGKGANGPFGGRRASLAWGQAWCLARAPAAHS